MDNAFELYHDRIIEAIEQGEVVCLFFPRLGKTLIIDPRHSDTAPPAIFIENMVRSPRERLESLRRLRPEFSLPEEMRLVPWFGFVGSLDDAGVTRALLRRCTEAGDLRMARACTAALRELRRIEHQIMRAIIRGESSRTIWERPRA
ncbi:MAG TPA: hypothetical protein PK593_00290 [Thermomicrobiales bacterium]|jgi:hypothetical protein|nr:hypothetical protein [Chloroflexota bacterium]HQX61873.1 hypothetical protein [Thermomicrobiales bacterium]HBY47450.1 hypothetical protein [Chloroflexota bacterium]HCG30341.1 hypothetical protein [Chloroflexota bacterium]HQZ89184.1 hypothetical protein [Thermomicrobiales bacterium]